MSKGETFVCQGCGGTFVKKRTAQRFHTSDCFNTWRRTSYNRVDHAIRKCAYDQCSIMFKPRLTTQRWHSGKCRRADISNNYRTVVTRIPVNAGVVAVGAGSGGARGAA